MDFSLPTAQGNCTGRARKDESKCPAYYGVESLVVREEYMKGLWLLIPTLVCTANLQAQSASHRTPSSSADPSSDHLSAASLKVDSLCYGRDISRIYLGDFDNVHLDRNSLGLSIMMDTYMRNFGVVCPQALPKNKVEIMNAECKTESYQIYARTGFEVPGTRMCSEDRIVDLEFMRILNSPARMTHRRRERV